MWKFRGEILSGETDNSSVCLKHNNEQQVYATFSSEPPLEFI